MEKFRNLGLKLTPQRMAIFEYLEDNTQHPSAEEIFSAVKKKFPTMSFATVYNTLEALKNRGEITELTSDPDRRRYDPNTHRHHHLICVACKKIVDIHTEFNLSIPDQQQESFEVTGNHVDFYGICPVCKVKESGRRVS